MSRNVLPLLILLLAAGVAWAQEPVNTAGDTVQEQRARGIEDNPEEPDSVLQTSVYTFHMRPMAVKIEQLTNIFLDPSGTQHHDPLTSQRGHYYLSKGIVGQSHLDLYPTLGTSLGWRYQPDVNAGYALNPFRADFYQTRKPYSLLSYSSSLKKEYTLRVRHTQNITPRWNIALDYLLLNPEPIFSNEDTKNNYLAVTSNFYSPDSRYQAYAALLWQRWKIGENGGLANDNTFRNNSMSDLSGIPVNNYNARSLYNRWTLYTHQSYNLVRQVQRIREHIELQVSSQDSNVLDTLVYYDTLHPAAHHVFNAGVIGLDLSADRSARLYTDSTTIHRYLVWLYWTNDAYPDGRYGNPLKVRLGARPEWYRINEHDTLRYRWQNVTATAQVALRLGRDTLAGDIQYTAGDSLLRDDRLLAAHFTHRLDSLQTLTLFASSLSQSPEFFYLHYHSNGLAWDAPSLEKNRIGRFALCYRYDRYVQCELTANHIGRATWLEDNGTALQPVQNSRGFWLLQGRLFTRFSLFHWLNCELEQFLQYSSDDSQWDAPLWASKNSLFAEFPLFGRAMRMQAGIDLRYHTPFYADAYQPAPGAFVRQRSIEVGNYLWGDLFVNMQVRKVTIFLKAGHLNALWEMTPDYFLLPHYPGSKFGFYYGLVWRFFD